MGTMTLERGVAGGVSQAGNHTSVAKKGDFKTCTLLLNGRQYLKVGTTVLTLAGSRLLKASVRWV